MTIKHTPGPWNVWGIPGEIDLAVGPVEGGIAVAQVVTTNAHGFATERTTTTGAANAALIAAAPDLLAALQLLEQSGEWQGTSWAIPAKAWRDARAAISRATGA